MDFRKYACDTERMGRPATGQTPIRNLRVPDDEWVPFRAVGGSNMSALIRQFIRWYLRLPGAKLPERPSPEHIAQLDAAQHATAAD